VKNFPFHKERSDLDIALEDGATDEVFLDALEGGLRRSLDSSQPELVVYLAGADPYRGDALGRLSLTKSGLARRDRMVLEACRGSPLPVALTMSGGYAEEISDTVDIHFETIRAAVKLSKSTPPTPSGPRT
jgi:acetoin utilization deacetylase AcuC-like enzyme